MLRINKYCMLLFINKEGINIKYKYKKIQINSLNKKIGFIFRRREKESGGGRERERRFDYQNIRIVFCFNKFFKKYRRK